MNMETRILICVDVEDKVEADEILTTVMGDQVEPRREFIEKNVPDMSSLDSRIAHLSGRA